MAFTGNCYLLFVNRIADPIYLDISRSLFQPGGSSPDTKHWYKTIFEDKPITNNE